MSIILAAFPFRFLDVDAGRMSAVPATAHANATLVIPGETGYLIAVTETAASAATGRSSLVFAGYQTVSELSPGLLAVASDVPDLRVDITVEVWGEQPPLSDDGGFAEVVEVSPSAETDRLRVLTEGGSLVLEVPATGTLDGTARCRLRLYVRYLHPRHAVHVVQAWPAGPELAGAQEWTYLLDERGNPVPRVDRTGGERVTLTLSAGQANAISMEAQERAILESQSGDVDDIADDCVRIRELIGYRADPSGEVEVALTAGEWELVVTVLNMGMERFADGGEPGYREELRQAREAVVSQLS